MEHSFTNTIQTILKKYFGTQAQDIFETNLLIQYIHQKTKSADSGAKARGSFGNLYALFVLIEDYVNHQFHLRKNEYAQYEGALFSKIFQRQRELPFGSKLQNHALNNRMNAEFQKFFPAYIA
jgi:hypothetical protein